MSDWLVTRIAEQKEAVEQARNFDYAAGDFYAEVLRQCDLLAIACVKNNIHIQIKKVGSSEPVQYTMLAMDGFTQRLAPLRFLTVFMAMDKRSIRATSDSGDVTLELGFYPTENRATGLEGGEPVEAENAAEILFDGFLFAGKSPYAFPLV